MNQGSRHRVAVIGAGAAGCFCAIELSKRLKRAEICVFEAGDKPMAKLALTGGGRCNLTNSFADVRDLGEVYPRGKRLMKRALAKFSPEDCRDWFEEAGVALVLQEDQCVFPASQDAMQIVHTLTSLLEKGGVKLSCGCRVTAILKDARQYRIHLSSGQCHYADSVLVTTGGSPSGKGLEILDSLGIDTIKCVPSLFTFRTDEDSLKELAGIVIKNAKLRITGTKLEAQGELLLTDWGLSGPAALRLSSYAARYLDENSYRAPLSINWTGTLNEVQVQEELQLIKRDNAAKKLSSVHPFSLQERLWQRILAKCGFSEQTRWAGLNGKGLTRLSAILTNDTLNITSRCRFKEEFVTCGGVSLSSIDINTMECKKRPGLFFAGEVLDVDAVTGGFNLQAAWSMGFVAAESIAKRASISHLE